ncbi:hypothetical protein [Paraburkholderia tagetis]|uniref:Uncharacterized protein n=1 Tax=Paraburkholderia tagetis TaxID=2913261 RepID=A0A9X1RVM8_9BURK|nr:hypothetical protein [Paraburkholderia tagetis]MCG5076971.1 hypothetical protein [Paraburkholderia tagetis]
MDAHALRAVFKIGPMTRASSALRVRLRHGRIAAWPRLVHGLVFTQTDKPNEVLDDPFGG